MSGAGLGLVPTHPEVIVRVQCPDGVRFEVDTFVNGALRFHGVFGERRDAWEAAEHALLAEMAASDFAASSERLMATEEA